MDKIHANNISVELYNEIRTFILDRRLWINYNDKNRNIIKNNIPFYADVIVRYNRDYNLERIKNYLNKWI